MSEKEQKLAFIDNHVCEVNKSQGKIPCSITLNIPSSATADEALDTLQKFETRIKKLTGLEVCLTVNIGG